MEDTPENWNNYLKLKGMSQETIKQYNHYYYKLRIALKEYPLDQNLIDGFILVNKSNLVKSFVKNYLTFIGNKQFEVRKMTGRVEKKKTELIPEEHIIKLREYFYNKEDIKYGLILDLTYSCALRRQEVLGIKAGDFSWIERKEDPNAPIKLIIKKGKGNKQRFVIVPNLLMEAIRLYIQEKNIKAGEKLFKINSYTWWEVFNEACLKLFNKPYKPHALRHTKASNWWSSGIDIVRIQQRLGHSNISTTRLYISPDEETELKKWRDES